MKDKRNRHGAVDKSSSEQHFRKSATITFRVIAKSGLMAYGLVALWPCGLQSFFCLYFCYSAESSHWSATRPGNSTKLLIDY